MTELADGGGLQLFDCNEIVGKDALIKEVPKEVQGTDVKWEWNTLKRAFSNWYEP